MLSIASRAQSTSSRSEAFLDGPVVVLIYRVRKIVTRHGAFKRRGSSRGAAHSADGSCPSEAMYSSDEGRGVFFLIFSAPPRPNGGMR